MFFKAEGVMSLEDMLTEHINDFLISDFREWMLKGDNYYKAENEILNKSKSNEIYSSNNKLAHGYMKKLVDEKVNYLLAKEYSLSSSEKGLADKITEVYGKKLQYRLVELGYEVSNKGIGWLQVYVNKEGKLSTMVIPSEECCPVWKDKKHEELEGVLRIYSVEEYHGTTKKIATKVEYWTAEMVRYYVLDNGKLILDSEKYFDIEGEYGHYTVNGKQLSFGKVPFIPFKNNHIEYGDLRFIKTLIDSYDNTRSENANYIEDVKNLIYVLKGYMGQDLKEFMEGLKKYRAVSVDGENGGVDTLNPNMDISASKEHFEQLDRDIIKFGQGVLIGQESLGNSPSGVALKFLYSGLDLKCNSFEREFQQSFTELIYFANVYLKTTSQSTITGEVNITFNRDIAVNESDTIQQCVSSKDIISDETIIKNHPWVNDPEEELKRIEIENKAKVEQQQKAFGSYDFKNGGVVDENNNKPNEPNKSKNL